jgi:hypothetical protein
MKQLAIIIATLLAIVFTQPQPSVNFVAKWVGSGVARLTWMQPTDTSYACLTRIPASGQAVPLDCYHDIPAGSQVVIHLGATAPVDGNFRPKAGDNYELYVSGETYTSKLQTVLRMPVFYS